MPTKAEKQAFTMELTQAKLNHIFERGQRALKKPVGSRTARDREDIRLFNKFAPQEEADRLSSGTPKARKKRSTF